MFLPALRTLAVRKLPDNVLYLLLLGRNNLLKDDRSGVRCELRLGSQPLSFLPPTFLFDNLQVNGHYIQMIAPLMFSLSTAHKKWNHDAYHGPGQNLTMSRLPTLPLFEISTVFNFPRLQSTFANSQELLRPSHQIFYFPRFPPSLTLDLLNCFEAYLSFVASAIATVLEK